MSAIQQVADWNVEAKREKNSDFFVPFDMMDRVIDGRRSIVVGRKGTGKTALAKYITQNFDSVLLDFDLVRFNYLISEKENIFNGAYEFSKIWRFIILYAAVEKMFRDKRLDYDTMEKLSSLFDGYSKNIGTNGSFIKKITGGINFSGIAGISGALERDDSREQPDLRAHSDWFETILKSANPENKIYVIFDELDVDIKSMNITKDKYINLVVSLINSVIAISDGPLSKYIIPIVFIREDLFDMLGNYSNKWSDYTYKLSWPLQKIIIMLTRRLKMATGLESDVFDNQWALVYGGGRLKNGSGKIVSIDYIQKHTQNRPRDYIAFIREAAREAVGMERNLIDTACLDLALPHFSSFLLKESNLELEMLFEEYKKIMPTLSQIGKQLFRIGEFESLYSEKTRNLVNAPDALTVLGALRDYSIVGNVLNAIPLFAYQSATKPTNFTQILGVHPGLRKALHII